MIEDICKMDFQTDHGSQEYYIIKPIQPGSATIYLSVDNSKCQERMRPILS